MKAYFMRTAHLGFSEWDSDDIDYARMLWGHCAISGLIRAGRGLSDEEIREHLSRELDINLKYGIQYWPVFMLAAGQFVGCCGLRPYDLQNKIFKAGVFFLPEFWDKDYAEEAMAQVLQYAFTILKARNLLSGHPVENEQTRRILEKLGFHFEKYECYGASGMNHMIYTCSAGHGQSEHPCELRPV